MSSIDSADWHFGADNFPEDLPEENGATHIGWFVRWAMGKGLFANETEAAPEKIEAVGNGTMPSRDFVMEELDGALGSADFSAEGSAFAEAHYSDYLEDVGKLSETFDLDSPYLLEDNEENYRKMAAALDARWARFKSGT